MSSRKEYNSVSDSTTEKFGVTKVLFGQNKFPAAGVPTGKERHTGLRTFLPAVSLLSTSGQQTVFYRGLWFAHDLGAENTGVLGSLLVFSGTSPQVGELLFHSSCENTT